jgi:transglutaminase/protease-like cytokinesis protein 3
MIYTHLPSSKAYQYLDPPIEAETFFALPHVCAPYFLYNMSVVNFDPTNIELVDDQGMLA